MQLFKKTTKELVKEWKPVLDKYGIAESKREYIAPLIAGQCDGRSCDEVLKELNQSGDVAGYNSVVIPMISRAFPGVIGPEIFGFQPIDTPSGLIFYMTRHYTNDSANVAKPATSVVLVLADASSFAVGDGIANTASAATGVVRYKEDNTILVSGVSGTFAVGDSVDDANPFVGAETTVSAVYTSEIAYQQVFADYNDFASVALAEAATTGMKEVELRIQSSSVTVTNHQIKVRWTRQMEYDLRKLHGKDAEAILSNAAAQEFALSLNQKMINLIKTSAALGGVTSWNYTAADGRWEVEKYQNLMATINRVSANMLVDNHMGLGNFLIIDPVTFASLDTMGLIDKSGVAGGIPDPMISPFSGVLMGRYRVYQDIFETNNRIYMGYKDFSGNPEAELKAGYFLSVYKAIDSIKMIGEDDGHPRKIFESRYALTANPFGADKFFRQINILNLPT